MTASSLWRQFAPVAANFCLHRHWCFFKSKQQRPVSGQLRNQSRERLHKSLPRCHIFGENSSSAGERCHVLEQFAAVGANFQDNKIEFCIFIHRKIVDGVKMNKRDTERFAAEYGIDDKNAVKELCELAIVSRARWFAVFDKLAGTMKGRYDNIVALYRSQVNLSNRIFTGATASKKQSILIFI
jgi:hypothetical protein